MKAGEDRRRGRHGRSVGVSQGWGFGRQYHAVPVQSSACRVECRLKPSVGQSRPDHSRRVAPSSLKRMAALGSGSSQQGDVVPVQNDGTPSGVRAEAEGRAIGA